MAQNLHRLSLWSYSVFIVEVTCFHLGLIIAHCSQVSLCAEPMRELGNPGASGSIFYLSNDDEFILKTVQHKEAEFLQKLLPGYYMNLNQNPHTLLPKFFGMYCYQCNQKNIRLTVMNNLLPSNVRMHIKFDLKGSTYKRKVIYSIIWLKEKLFISKHLLIMNHEDILHHKTTRSMLILIGSVNKKFLLL